MTSPSPLRVAICGLGAASLRAHLPALTSPELEELVTVVALCDRDQSRLLASQGSVPAAQLFSDIDQMLATQPLDLLVIATPPSSHMAALVAAAKRGVDVVCEKPLGLDLGDVHELRSLARQHPKLRIAQKIRAASTSGSPTSIEIDVERPGTDPLSAEGWRAHPGNEGGILGDHAVHHLGLLDHAAGACEIVSCERRGGGGRETASIEVRARNLDATIKVTYAANRRRNRVHLNAGGQKISWIDDRFSDGDEITGVESLSDRGFVNALYIPWYQELLTTFADPEARRVRTRETISVAHLLQTAIAASEESVAATVVEQLSLNALARAVLLAFADLGIYLPSQRERLLAKIRSLDPLEPQQLEEFISLCIDARLLNPEAAGRLRLSPSEARRLAHSLEGATPVPDVQASDWATALMSAIG